MKKICQAITLLAVSINCMAPGFCMTPEAAQLHQQAMAKMNAGEYAEALNLDTRAARLDPNAGEPHAGLSYILSKMNRFREALGEAQNAVHLTPNDPWVHRNLAYILQSIGMCAVAIPEYQKSNQLKPDVENEISIAQCQLSMGSRTQGIQSMEALRKAHPDDYVVLINLAKAYIALDNTAGAGEASAAALKLKPNSYEPNFILAQVNANQHKYHEAEQYGQQLLRIDPKNPDTYTLLSSMYSNNEPQKAADLLNQAKRNVPRNGDVFLLMARSYFKESERASKSVAGGANENTWLELSKRALQFAVEADPKNVNYRIGMADVLEHEHDLQGALEQVRVAHNLQPDDPRVQQLYKRLLAERNDIAGCLKRWCYRKRT
jgi:tetratricopeptide (TPR) repeat protein